MMIVIVMPAVVEGVRCCAGVIVQRFFPRRVVVIEFASWLPGRACHGLLSRTSPKGISRDETAIARDLA
jgi:hypothetical protein